MTAKEKRRCPSGQGQRHSRKIKRDVQALACLATLVKVLASVEVATCCPRERQRGRA